MTSNNREEVIPRVTREEKYPGITKCSRPAGRKQEKNLNVVSFIQNLLEKGVKILNSISSSVSLGKDNDFSSIKVIKGKSTPLKKDDSSIIKDDKGKNKGPKSKIPESSDLNNNVRGA